MIPKGQHHKADFGGSNSHYANGFA